MVSAEQPTSASAAALSPANIVAVVDFFSSTVTPKVGANVNSRTARSPVVRTTNFQEYRGIRLRLTDAQPQRSARLSSTYAAVLPCEHHGGDPVRLLALAYPERSDVVLHPSRKPVVLVCLGSSALFLVGSATPTVAAGIASVPGPRAAHVRGDVTSPGRVTLRVSGERLGKSAKIALHGLSGRARGYDRVVSVRKSRVLRHLPTGRYRIKARVIMAPAAAQVPRQLQRQGSLDRA